MKLSSLHLLLTYQCTLECEHCFVWGSPFQKGRMTLAMIRAVLQQAKDTGTIDSIYFEGGEPFLYYATLLKGVQEACAQGFSVGIVTNCFWATDPEDALECLRPFVGLINDLSLSSDLYHWDEPIGQEVRNALSAAQRLNIPVGIISIAQPDAAQVVSSQGQLPQAESAVMFRGRAAKQLTSRAFTQPWVQFNSCPHEDLREPGRVHLDPFGNLHICQGISVGNLFDQPLRLICESYDPDSHPIVAPLLIGGPAELVRKYQLPHVENYADACHLCYEARLALRSEYPHILLPDQMYGVY